MTALRLTALLLLTAISPTSTSIVAASPQFEDDAPVIPSSDPWFSPEPEFQRPGLGGGPGAQLVLKARITPHWFDKNTRFWYRNDLAGGAREFMVVDAARGLRAHAFDQHKLAASLKKATGDTEISPERLPFDRIDFVDEQTAIVFKVGDTTWKCRLDTYECSKSTEPPPAEEPATEPPAAARTRTRTRPDGDRGGRSPDGKWTAFIKDHNVFIRSANGSDKESEEVQLSKDGKEGLAYGRLSWSPDSKTLVAFRVEPGERKEVFLIQSSPPGGGRAKLMRRPYELPGDRFTAYELNLFDPVAKTQTKPEAEPHRLRRSARPLVERWAPLHLRKVRPRPPALPPH